MDNVEKLIHETNKSFGRDVLGYASKMKIGEKISTGSAYLDWALSGGLPLGRIIEIYGPFASGKTCIALRTIAEAQKKGLTCLFIDAELSFSKELAIKSGVDLDKLLFLQTSSGEKIFEFIRTTMKSIPKGVVVIDSVAAMVAQYEENNEIEKQTMGLTARLMSKGLRIINNSNDQWLVIFINQIREKIGVVYGSPEYRPGGRAIDFFSSALLNIRIGEKYEDDKRRVGHEIKFRVEKSKIGIPFRSGSIKYFYETGFDDVDDLLSLAMELGLAQQAGAWYTVLGERFQGKAGIEAKCKTDKAFFEKLKKELYAKMAG
jgi:recombination protein RecA